MRHVQKMEKEFVQRSCWYWAYGMKRLYGLEESGEKVSGRKRPRSGDGTGYEEKRLWNIQNGII